MSEGRSDVRTLHSYKQLEEVLGVMTLCREVELSARWRSVWSNPLITNHSSNPFRAYASDETFLKESLNYHRLCSLNRKSKPFRLYSRGSYNNKACRNKSKMKIWFPTKSSWNKATATNLLEQPLLTETRAMSTSRVDLAPLSIITHGFSSDFDL